MNLGEYFDGAKGQGVLATADGSGKVNVAVYARPHFLDDETALFIMADRLSHENLSSNPWSTYIFIDAGEGCSGPDLLIDPTRPDGRWPSPPVRVDDHDAVGHLKVLTVLPNIVRYKSGIGYLIGRRIGHTP
jgi:hypothetical protein